MWSQAWSKEKGAMGGNTSLHQGGSSCQKQLSHQEEPGITAKLEFAWWEVTGHKISSDLVLVHWANQKAYVKISGKRWCACARDTEGEWGKDGWLPPESTSPRWAILLQTSGKTRVSRMYGWGGLTFYTSTLILFFTIVLFCRAGQ